jgi:uncharacterized membrane protein HdeD (DUF308 family)
MNYESLKKVFLIEGCIFVILGLLAIALPTVFTLGVEQFLGWLLVIGGVVGGYRFITLHNYREKGWLTSLLITALYIITGGMLIAYPLSGILSLTLLLAFFMLLDGISKIIYAFKTKIPHYGWLIFSGILSLLIAAIIVSGFPGTASWVLGLLFGINMLFAGAALLSLGFASKDKVN